MEAIYLVPTRGRPQNALRLLEQWKSVTTEKTRLCFVIDTDDPKLDEYTDIFNDRSYDDFQFGWQVDRRRRLGGTLNFWAPKLARNYDAVGFMGDDHLPITPGWDTELTSTLTPASVVYGNDMVMGPNLPTAVLLGSGIIETLGWMIPPGLTHMYLDNFWRDLGSELGTLQYRGDVIIQHIHPITGKVPWDPQYVEVSEHMGPDAGIYQSFLAADGITKSAAKIREALKL
jgi:hypothetical protein